MSYIHPTALIGPNVSIGENCYIGPYCIIGYTAEHKEFWNREPGGVSIGDNVVLTGHVTIDASTGDQPTFIGDDVNRGPNWWNWLWEIPCGQVFPSVRVLRF